MGETSQWQYMWGAKVKMPCDMEDDVLEDAIKHITQKLGHYENEEWEKNGLQVCQDIKHHMDKTWEPYWVVAIGRNFGSYVTHVTKRFVYFYYNEKAVMVYKAAQGMYRGAVVAASWTLAVDVYDVCFRESIIKKRNKEYLQGSSKLSLIGRSYLRNSISFGLFLGTMAGVTCVVEHFRNVKDWKNTFAGGFSAGILLGYNVPSPIRVVGTATAIGVLATIGQNVNGS